MNEPDHLAERQAAYTERLGQRAIPPEPDEEEPRDRLPLDRHDHHRCVMEDPSDPWSRQICDRPW